MPLVANSRVPHPREPEGRARVGLQEPPIPEEELAAIADETSQCERRSVEAERELMEWKKVRFMQDRVGEEFPALILNPAKYGLFVELEDLFVEGDSGPHSCAGTKASVLDCRRRHSADRNQACEIPPEGQEEESNLRARTFAQGQKEKRKEGQKIKPERPPNGGRSCTHCGGGGSLLRTVGLFFGHTAYYWQLVTLAAKCTNQQDDPDDKKCQSHEL